MKVGLFIDADNTQLSRLPKIFAFAEGLGTIVVRKAYGNWVYLSRQWAQEIPKYGIAARQCFSTCPKKNASDISLTIDVTEKLVTGEDIDTYVIVSSDSDFTPLAMVIKTRNRKVVGIGKNNTPENFKNACSRFVDIERLGEEDPDAKKVTLTGKKIVEELLQIGKIKHYRDKRGYVNLDKALRKIASKYSIDDFSPADYGKRHFYQFLENDRRFKMDGHQKYKVV
jgi:hypothetical protein